MGHIKRKRPRRGSLQFWHRKRARRIYPRVRNWNFGKTAKLLSFTGYKAGMTHVLYVESAKKSSRKGEEIRRPVTIVEVPEMKVLAIRAYKKDSYGLKPCFEVWADSIDIELKRKLKLPKKKTEQQKIKQIEDKISEFSDIRVLAYTKPEKIKLKKKPDLMEIAIGGNNVSEKFNYAKEILGTEIDISKVFKEGEFVDVHAVTTGKGLQGVVKRFHVKLKSHKAEKGRRRIGTLGNWDAKTWRVAHPGQTGYHTRTEHNKKILRISSESENKITPSGGIINYGKISGKYILLSGSIPGPKKRQIRLTTPKRAHKKSIEAPELLSINLRSQQGN